MNENDQKNQLWKLRHSVEHIFNQAVEELYPGKVMRAMGPPIEDGWYNDSRWTADISESDFPKIEKRMKKIIKANLPMIYKEISYEEAIDLFKDNPFKLEFIEEYNRDGKTLSVYYTGNPESEPGFYKQNIAKDSAADLPGDSVFMDLCAGPHIDRTGEVNPEGIKLLSIAGAYWRGDEKNEMLTRVYGTAFETKEDLDHHLEMLEEIKKRDHRKIGPQMEYFMFHETSPGMPYWLPRGLKIYNLLIQYWRNEHENHGYQEIASPLLNKSDLYKTSGHWDHYKDDMFIADMGENEIYGVKPMNCPNAMIVFGSQQRSYKDLPLRLSDVDRLHRYERSGTLNGLLRVRSFQQDDSHNYVSEDMIKSEYKHVFDLCESFYSIFGLTYSFRMGTRPEKFMGDPETWDRAEQELQEVLEESGKQYIIEEGDGAFYGPKIDILMNDALGREWQMGTIQLDFQQPRSFNLTYVDAEGKEKVPVAIHRVIYGSLERFLGIVIEHFAGAFPVWLHPEQVAIIPVSEKFEEYANKVKDQIKEVMPEARIKTFNESERMQKRIREAQLMKIPYMIIVGGNEEESGSVSVRLRTEEDLGQMSVDDFVGRLKERVNSKSLEL